MDTNINAQIGGGTHGKNNADWIDSLATHLTIIYGFLGRSKYDIITKYNWKAESIYLEKILPSHTFDSPNSKLPGLLLSKNLIGVSEGEIKYILNKTCWEAIEMRFSNFTVTISGINGGHSNCATVTLDYECDWELLRFKFNSLYVDMDSNVWYDAVNDIELEIINDHTLNFTVLVLSKMDDINTKITEKSIKSGNYI